MALSASEVTLDLDRVKAAQQRLQAEIAELSNQISKTLNASTAHRARAYYTSENGNRWSQGMCGSMEGTDLDEPRGHSTQLTSRDVPIHRKPLMLPEKFSGKRRWSDYSFHFENVAEINGWTLCEKAQFLVASLEGDAHQVVCDLPYADRRVYHLIVGALAHRFGDEQQRPLHQAQLTTRVRQKGEPLQQLGYDVRRLVNLAYPTIAATARNEIAMEHFCRALNDVELQRSVFMSKPRDLNEAISTATSIEAFTQAQRRPQARLGHSVHGLSSADSGLDDGCSRCKAASSMPCDLVEVANSLKGCVEKLQNMPIQQQTSPAPEPVRACWRCGGTDHFRRDCPDRPGRRRRHEQLN